MCSVLFQGQTTPLDAVPSVLETGQRMAIASGGTTLGLSMSNQTAVAWALSFKASESRVHEVNAKLQNRAAAQVRHRSKVQYEHCVFRCQPSFVTFKPAFDDDTGG